LVVAASPTMTPAPVQRPSTARQRAPNTRATSSGSVRAVGAKRMLKGERAIRAAAANAVGRPYNRQARWYTRATLTVLASTPGRRATTSEGPKSLKNRARVSPRGDVQGPGAVEGFILVEAIGGDRHQAGQGRQDQRAPQYELSRAVLRPQPV
jgi:hypothetical protein